MSNQTGMMMMLALHCIPPGPLICFRQLPIARVHARDIYIRMHDRHFYSNYSLVYLSNQGQQ